MSASMSSRRKYVPEFQAAAPSGVVLAIAAFVVGIVLMVVAAKTSSAIVAVPGFVATASGFLYLNLRFWERTMRDKK